MSNGISISKETFLELDTDAKLIAVFDVLVAVHSQCRCRLEKCDARFDKLENRKKWDTTASAFFGVIGGAAAMLIKWVVGK